jgi:hypothetical protein
MVSIDRRPTGVLDDRRIMAASRHRRTDSAFAVFSGSTESQVTFALWQRSASLAINLWSKRQSRTCYNKTKSYGRLSAAASLLPYGEGHLARGWTLMDQPPH